MAPLPRVFMDFAVSDKPLGRVVFELFTDRVPKTAENFRCLCTGEKGLSRASGLALSYKGSPIHRVIDGFMIQGGDFTKRNGTGGESIYGGMFADERLEGEGTEVNKSGLLVMANRGPNTNGSQYFVTLAPAPHLTGKHVVFGRVVTGFEHIAAIGKLPTDDRDRPFSGVTIAHCGELELRRPPAAVAVPPPAKRGDSISPPPKRNRGTSRSISPADSRDRSRSRSPVRRRRASVSDDSEDDQHRRERRARKAEKREAREKRKQEKRARGSKAERKETAEELDERLEREENERLEKARMENEETTKRRKEEERKKAEETGGVVYKGRGAMRYLDPETRFTRNVPTNYDHRQTSVYASNRRFRGAVAPQGNGNGNNNTHGDGADSERWQKGVDARPTFNRERRDGALDKYRTKGEDDRRERRGDDWRFGEGRQRDARDVRREARADRWAAETKRTSRSRSRSPPPPRRQSRSRSPPPARMRSASPLRGDRDRDDESGSDMVMENDD